MTFGEYLRESYNRWKIYYQEISDFDGRNANNRKLWDV